MSFFMADLMESNTMTHGVRPPPSLGEIAADQERLLERLHQRSYRPPLQKPSIWRRMWNFITGKEAQVHTITGGVVGRPLRPGISRYLDRPSISPPVINVEINGAASEETVARVGAYLDEALREQIRTVRPGIPALIVSGSITGEQARRLAVSRQPIIAHPDADPVVQPVAQDEPAHVNILTDQPRKLDL